MFAMRLFDHEYAPKTVVESPKDPGMTVVRGVERALHLGRPSAKVERGAALSVHLAYGTLYGVLFAMAKLLLPKNSRHPFLFGGTLGVIVWAIGYLGLLPAAGIARSATEQTFPEVAGELTRHVAYGVATAAAFGVIHDAL
jgi:hypothetical protein